jgi:hypothetical protein
MPEELALFSEVKKRIVTEELNEQFSLIHEVARILSKIVSPGELPDLLLTCLKGLNDPQLSSTSGTCVVLNGTFSRVCMAYNCRINQDSRRGTLAIIA